MPAMNPATSLSPVATADQLGATRPRGAHSHGSHFVMTEGNTKADGAGNAGAVQSFAQILAHAAGTAVNIAAGAAKTMLL
jgi:hypothetical protein